MEALKSLNPLIIDGIVVLLILIVAVIRAKIGLYRIVSAIAVFFLATAIALAGSQVLGPYVTDLVWEKTGPKIEERVDTLLDQFVTEDGTIVSGGEGGGLLGQVIGLDELPEGEEWEGAALGESFREALETFAMARLKRIGVIVSKVLCFIIIYLIAALLLKLVTRALGKISDWSVLGWLNHGGGFVLGAIEMTVLLIVLSRTLPLIGVTFLSDLAEDTTVLKWLSSGDLSAAILQIKETAARLGIENFSLKNLKNFDITQLNLNNLDLKNLNLNGLDLNSIDLNELDWNAVDWNKVDLNGVDWNNLDVNKLLTENPELQNMIPDNVNVEELINGLNQ